MHVIQSVFCCILLVFFMAFCSQPKEKSDEIAGPISVQSKETYVVPDSNTIPEDELGNLIRYGMNLIQNTSYFIGPEGIVSKNLGNKMNCTNCHLQNGTKAYGLSFFNTHNSYPQFRARENRVLSLAERVNNCIERPHSGKSIPLNSKEMIAIISYIKWVGENFDAEKHNGHSLLSVSFEGLAADPERGALVYKKHCQSCHQTDGEGMLNAQKTSYLYPPLWGKYAYQESSSMHRVIKAASFIKYNMPNNTTNWETPVLTDQEALDVAAFINDGSIHPRPKSKQASYEKIQNKPIDYFKGPYLDTFPEKMHAFGPWDKIISFYKLNNHKVIF